MEPNQEQFDAQATRNNRIKFFLVVALFILPVASALYLKVTGWRPQTTINHGTLVQPVRPAPDLLFTTAAGKKFTQKDLEGRWNILVAITAKCDKLCQKNLYAIRQIHIGQGKHQHRVRRIFLSTGYVSGLKNLQKQYPDLVILKAGSASMARFKDWTAIKDSKTNLIGTRVFMIDPLGNYMMYYPEEFDPAKMRRDLARLLRVSHIG